MNLYKWKNKLFTNKGETSLGSRMKEWFCWGMKSKQQKERAREMYTASIGECELANENFYRLRRCIG
jgi:hypothetical protein